VTRRSLGLRWGVAAILLAAVAACSQTPSGSPGSSDDDVVPALVLGCLSIEQFECEFVATKVLHELPAERGAPFTIQIHLFSCPDANPGCPRSLLARDGQVTVEYADGGEPINRSVSGPPAEPRFGEGLFDGVGLSQPSSPRVAGVGPFAFDVGHCGITWQVDFDGSFWVPIGQADGDASAMINGDSGQIRLLGPTLAEYRNAEGLVTQLARFPGPKHIWGCM
jgi:hypothetical protein